MVNKTRTFQELVVWQKAHQLVLDIYKFLKNFLRMNDLV